MRKNSPGKYELGAKTPIDIINPLARKHHKTLVKLPAAMVQETSASVLYGPKDLRLDIVTLDDPGPTELQIQIKATTLCGSDLHYYKHYRNGDIQVREPLSLGHESAGVVHAVGSQVENFRVGDRVALEVGLPCGESMRFRSSAKAFPHAQGTLQDIINHPAAWCHKLPDCASLEAGALLEPLSVAIQATRRAEVTHGSSVLVLGAGAIGLLCAAVCQSIGARHIVIADIQPDRVQFAIKHGFASSEVTIPRKKGHSIDEEIQIARESAALARHRLQIEAESEAAFDVVFECTGVEACTQAAIYASRPGGMVVIVGMGNPIQTIPISAAALPIELATSQNSGLPDLARIITHRYHGLSEVKRAFEMAGETHDEEGNIVLKVLVEAGA
uniref:Putative sorbitol dehydrogenase n=1 Tax=Cladonia uncialis subsp. uncialis TaxID=180999 RepID=A0A2K9YD08_CLAUC|nr:putative sorbitol dehydrogenase [Cladonia uncialis subsp. uncialis]